jgi:hypothetical protein
MDKDPWHKGRITKIKNSHAANMLKGAAHSAFNYLGLTEESMGRNDHFDHGANEHQTTNYYVREDDIPKDNYFESKGLGMGSIENISSIRNGIAIRGAKAARRPEGY